VIGAGLHAEPVAARPGVPDVAFGTEAAGLLGQYKSYLDKYGRPAEFAPPAGAEAADGADLGGVFDFVFTLGPFFAGVSQAADALSGSAKPSAGSLLLVAAEGVTMPEKSPPVFKKVTP
jgi:hypothetical protein